MSNPSLENAYAYAAQLQNKAIKSLPRYVRRTQLRQIVPLADTTIWEMEQRNEFPRRILLTSRVVAWNLAEVETWLERRRLDTESGALKPSAAPDVTKRKQRPVRRK